MIFLESWYIVEFFIWSLNVILNLFYMASTHSKFISAVLETRILTETFLVFKNMPINTSFDFGLSKIRGYKILNKINYILSGWPWATRLFHIW